MDDPEVNATSDGGPSRFLVPLHLKVKLLLVEIGATTFPVIEESKIDVPDN